MLDKVLPWIECVPCCNCTTHFPVRPSNNCVTASSMNKVILERPSNWPCLQDSRQVLTGCFGWE
jgi:hypothetical protein